MDLLSNGIETIGNFNEGKRVGKWEYYYDNKNLRRISIYNDKGEGRNMVWAKYWGYTYGLKIIV